MKKEKNYEKSLKIIENITTVMYFVYAIAFFALIFLMPYFDLSLWAMCIAGVIYIVSFFAVSLYFDVKKEKIKLKIKEKK